MMGGGGGSLCSNQEPLASEYLVPLGRVPTPVPHRCCPCQGPSLTRGLMSQGGGASGPRRFSSPVESHVHLSKWTAALWPRRTLRNSCVNRA